jgi:selenide,water dikinase
VRTLFSFIDYLPQYLEGISNTLKPNQTPGMDCSVVATRFPGVLCISTTDFFYPLVEDPYAQGRIAACNVLSDLYSNGVVDVDTMLMLLAVSSDMSSDERDIVTTAMIRGFNECCTEAGTSVTGGQTVSNPWPIVGGVATALVREEEMVRPEGCQPGDVLVLTKPLGTQVAVNVWQWRPTVDAGSGMETAPGTRQWPKLAEAGIMDLQRAALAFDVANESMSRLNKIGARLMHVHGARGCTDVTGFGLLGHARNLAAHCTTPVSMTIHTLPVVQGMVAVEDCIGGTFKLRAGLSSETSGGLLVSLPSLEAAQAYCRDLQAEDGTPAWIIGAVHAASADKPAGYVEISREVDIVEVGHPGVYRYM